MYSVKYCILGSYGKICKVCAFCGVNFRDLVLIVLKIAVTLHQRKGERKTFQILKTFKNTKAMKFENYMIEAIKTGSVIIPVSERTDFIDYLIRRGARSRFFFCEEVAGLIEVLY